MGIGGSCVILSSILSKKLAYIPVLALVTVGVSSITAPWPMLVIFLYAGVIGTLTRPSSDKVSSNRSLSGSEGYSSFTSERTVALRQRSWQRFPQKSSVQPVYLAQSHRVQVCRQGQGLQSLSMFFIFFDCILMHFTDSSMQRPHILEPWPFPPPSLQFLPVPVEQFLLLIQIVLLSLGAPFLLNRWPMGVKSCSSSI